MRQVHPALTVIIPARNAGKHLERAIGSITAQTVTDWEMIVTDDCSTDDTYAIAARHAEADPRIRMLRLDTPSGSAYMTRLHAANAAESNLIAPLDADDAVDPDYLATLLATRKATGAEVVYPTMLIYKGSEVSHTLPESESLRAVFTGHEAFKLTLCGWKIGCNGGIIDRSLYLDTYRSLGTDINYSCSDELHTRRLLASARKVAVSPARYHYLDNPASVTRTPGPATFDFMLNNQAIIQMTSLLMPDDAEAWRLAQSQNLCGVIDALRLLNRHRFDSETQLRTKELIRNSRAMMDSKELRKAGLLKYLTLLHTGIGPTRIILGLYDRFHPRRP